MKILTVNSPGQFLWRDVPTPQPGPDEVLMRVEAVTTCPRWDINVRHNSMFGKGEFNYPIRDGQPGHEAAGTVAALGANVTGFHIGQPICVWRDLGHQRQGCYAQYVSLPANVVLPVAEHLTVEEVASMELGMCVGASFLRLKQYNAIRGRRFGIMGLGPAGLVAAQMARAEGAAEIIGFDPSPRRRQFASSLLDKAYDPAQAESDFPIRPAHPALDCTIDCVGAKTSVQWAMDHTLEVVALFGVQKEPYIFGIDHYLNLTLAGYPGHSLEAATYALSLVESGQLNLSMLATHQLPLSSYNEGVDLLESQDAIKVRFLPWGHAAL